MTAILGSQRQLSFLLCQILLSVDGWMSIPSKVGHFCDIQIKDWGLHFPDY